MMRKNLYKILWCQKKNEKVGGYYHYTDDLDNLIISD